MPLEERHQYHIAFGAYVEAGGRTGITCRFQLDITQPQQVLVRFEDGQKPVEAWFPPNEVREEVTLCENGCFTATKTLRGRRCGHCGAVK